jgi:Uma2 family endonuclease
MATGIVSKLVTAEEFADISVQLEVLCELVRGEVREMTRPTVRHGGVCASISAILWNWAKLGRHGRVITNDASVVTQRDPDSVRGPDVCFITESRLPDGKYPKVWFEVSPELCVKVLSENDRWKDITDKASEYFACGVKEVWVADPELKQLHVLPPDPPHRVLKANDMLTSNVLPGFECRVSEFFEGC